jgi:membrane-associated protease RseP (regulator of RpoE activity)
MLAKTWLPALIVLVTTAAVLLVLYNRRVGELFHAHVRDRPKRRLFLAAIGFFVTFAVARALAYSVYRNTGPFNYVYVEGTHIHHLVFGIFLLLAVGFCWLIEVGTGERASSLLASRLMSLLYGIGAALTLDEFALWLNVQEGIYWTRRDLASVDAVVLFGAALLIGIWGGDFLKALGLELWHSRRKRRQAR